MKVVQLKTMRARLTRFRRTRWIDQQIRDGERLRDLRAARAGIDGSVWPDDAAEFDKMIALYERRCDRRLSNLKNTEAL